MKTLLYILLPILLLSIANSISAQMMMQNMQSPQGTLLTESFGDTGTQPCGYGTPWNTGLYAYQGCDHQLGKVSLGTGGSVTIAATPGSVAYPAGAKSLHIITGTTATYVEEVGALPLLSAPTAYTVTWDIYITSTTGTGYTPFYKISNSSTGSHAACLAYFHATVAGSEGVLGVNDTSGSLSSTIPISTGAHHKVVLTCVPGGGAGTSSISVDGGTPATFTASSYAGMSRFYGDFSGTARNIDFSIGYEKIDSNITGSGNGPTLLVNPSNSGQSNGTAITFGLMSSPTTIGGNCTWAAGGSGTNPWTFASGAVMNMLSALDALGTYYGPFSTLGMSYDMTKGSTNGVYVGANCFSFSPVWTSGYKLKTNLSYDGTSNWSGMAISSSADHVNIDLNAATNPLSVTLEIGAYSNPTTHDIGVPYTGLVTDGSTSYFITQKFEEYATCTNGSGADCIVQGTMTGVPIVGETFTSTAGETGAFVAVGGVGSLGSMEIVTTNAGAAGSTDTWTGGTSGATFVATSLPLTFHTLRIYDHNCTLVNEQKGITSSTSPALPSVGMIGRGGDVGNPSALVNVDWYQLDYVRGNQIPCR